MGDSLALALVTLPGRALGLGVQLRPSNPHNACILPRVLCVRVGVGRTRLLVLYSLSQRLPARGSSVDAVDESVNQLHSRGVEETAISVKWAVGSCG